MPTYNLIAYVKGNTSKNELTSMVPIQWLEAMIDKYSGEYYTGDGGTGESYKYITLVNNLPLIMTANDYVILRNKIGWEIPDA